MKPKRFILCFFAVFGLILSPGCSTSPKPVIFPSSYDFGCNQPPPDVFTKVGIDVHFAKSTFGKIVTGNIDVKSNPQIVTLASKAVTDDRIRSYLRCLAIKRDGYTLEQAAYLERLSAFMATLPSAQQFLEWQKINSFPLTSSEFNLPKGFYFNPTGLDDEILVIIESVQTGQKWKIYTSFNARVRALHDIAVKLLALKENLDTGSAVDYKIKWVLIDKSIKKPLWDLENRLMLRSSLVIVKDHRADIIYYADDPKSTLIDAKVYTGITFNLCPIGALLVPPFAAPPPPPSWRWRRERF